MFWHSKCTLTSWRDFSEFRHHTLKSGVFDFFGRAVALPLIRSTLVGRSYRVETPLFYFKPWFFISKPGFLFWAQVLYLVRKIFIFTQAFAWGFVTKTLEKGYHLTPSHHLR